MASDDTSANDRDGGSLLSESSGSTTSVELHCGEISLEESVILYRRRLGISQTQMAAMLKIHRETYGRLERGKTVQVEVPKPTLGNLSPYEVCFILRRRSGKTQNKIAESIGFTRYWLNQMELGKVSCVPLVEYWRNHAG